MTRKAFDSLFRIRFILSFLILWCIRSDNGRISKRLPFILHPTVCRYLDTCRRREMQHLTTSQVDQTQTWWNTGEAHQSVKSTQVGLTFLHFSCKFDVLRSAHARTRTHTRTQTAWAFSAAVTLKHTISFYISLLTETNKTWNFLQALIHNCAINALWHLHRG